MNTYPFEYGIDGLPPGLDTNPFTSDALAALNSVIFCSLAVAVIFLIIYVAIFYRIFKKAGYNGWLGLLTLIPGLGIIICLGILAFDTWPLLKPAAFSPPVAYPPNYQPAQSFQQQAVVPPQPIPAAGYPPPAPPAAYVPVDQAPTQVPVQPPADVPVQAPPQPPAQPPIAPE